MNRTALKKKIKGILRHQLTPVIAFGVVVGTVSGLIGLSNSNTKEFDARPDLESIMDRISELQTHVISMESSAKKSIPKIDLSAIETHLKELGQVIADREQFDPAELKKNIEQRLNQTEQIIQGQLNTLNNAVSTIKNTSNQVKYLSLKVLPFSVSSIDSIQNIPVASIQYDYKTLPIEKGDVLAGWKVVKVDFSRQQIEFENKNKEHVLIKHEHIG